MSKSNIGSSIAIYQTEKGPQLEVKLVRESVWLSQVQIAELFGTKRPAITKHLKNIFNSGELNRNSVSSILEHTAADGKRYGTQFYSLDAIISVGYRVNSKMATQFRIWATKTLKNHLLKGYTINRKKLLEDQKRFAELRGAIAFIEAKSRGGQLVGQEKELLSLLSSYAKTLAILGHYDSGSLKEPKGKRTSLVLEYDECRNIAAKLKNEIVSKNEAGDLFGVERGRHFEGIIHGLYQTFGGKELYPTAESKAAHLLYFVIKDHPFVDGNKRIGSFLFIYYLDKMDMLYKKNGEKKFNDNALVAIALLMAESRPQEKDVMLKIIANLIAD